MARLSRLATETNAAPFVGSEPYAAACDFANAVPKPASMPMTSPVDFISGPSTVSTPWKRPNGSTASLTEIDASGGRSAPSPAAAAAPRRAAARWWCRVMIRAAAFATGTAVAFETNGTVRLARGLASST